MTAAARVTAIGGGGGGGGGREGDGLCRLRRRHGAPRASEGNELVGQDGIKMCQISSQKFLWSFERA